MTHATHTQGPWTVSQPSGSYIEAPTGGIAALTYGASKADAHLIAAAPDMLELLVETQEALDVLADDAEDAGYHARAESAAKLAMRLRAAITKAKGA